MKQFVSKIWNSPSARNVGKLLSANIFAQVIGLLVYPILTRMYTPEDFGLLNLFLSIGGVLLILSTAQYQHAVAVTGKEQDAKGVFHAGLLCLVGSSILFFLIPLLAMPISHLFNAPELANYLWLMPLYVFFVGLWQLLSNWYNRNKAFDHISRYQIAQSVFSAGGKVGLGYGSVTGGLLYGTIGAFVFAGFGSLIAGWKRYVVKLWPCKWNAIRDAFQRFRNYPLYMLPSALVNAVNTNIAVWILTPLFGLDATGYFGMAMLLGYTPIHLITDSMYQVLLQNISVRVSEKQPIRKLFIQYMQKCALIVVPFFAILYFIMPWLVRVLLGEGWGETAHMLRYFLPWFALFCFSIPWNFIPLLFEKQRINLGFEIGLLLLRVVAISISGLFHSLTMFVIAYSAASAMILLVQLWWYGDLISQYEQKCQSIAE